MIATASQTVKLPTRSRPPLPEIVKLDFVERIEQIASFNERLSAWANSDIAPHVCQVAALALLHAQRAEQILVAALGNDLQRKGA